jgi:Asparaginase, N-terminal
MFSLLTASTSRLADSLSAHGLCPGAVHPRIRCGSPRSAEKPAFSNDSAEISDVSLLGKRRTLYEGTTGGTIDMVKNGDGPRMPSQQNGSVMEKLKDLLPHQGDRLQFSIFGKPTDSSSITRDLQGKLVQKVVEKIKADPSTAMLITHGTDTLMEDAALLSYQGLHSPIVLTGSWASAGEPGSDAERNILRARRVACELPVPGVFAVIGNDIIHGAQLNKVRSNPFNGPYFVSLADRPFGSFDEQQQIRFHPEALKDWKTLLAKRSASSRDASLNHPIQPAYVEHMVFHRSTPFVAFQQLVQRLQKQPKPVGAIFEGELSEHPQATEILAMLSELARQGIPGVTTSQTPLEAERAYNNCDHSSHAPAN